MKDGILVIEDDLALRPMWESIANRNLGGKNLDWAVSAEQAKRIFQSSLSNNQPYKVVVVDIFLAGSDTGMDFIKYIRSLGQETPVLLVSTAMEKDLKNLYHESMGNVQVLTKPLSVPKCEKALEKILMLKNA